MYKVCLLYTSTLGQLDIQALKIHMLFVVKNTKLQQMYENHEFNMLSRQEYIDIVVEPVSYTHLQKPYFRSDSPCLFMLSK